MPTKKIETPLPTPQADTYEPTPAAWMTAFSTSNIVITHAMKTAAPDRYAQFTVPLYRRVAT
jgi:hypothetical protein